VNLQDLLHSALGPKFEYAPSEDSTTVAVLHAALRQFELFGITRSTMEDIARRASRARVTIYRHFPDKDRLVEAVILRELRRFLADLEASMQSVATPEEKMVEGFVFTLKAVRSHRLLQRLLESEPEMLLPYLTVEGAPFIATARDFLAGHMARELDDERGGRELLVAAEIVVRLILSFLLTPQTQVDLDDREQARMFALRYLGPILGGAVRDSR
jgi:AcrR family transcriptional regulator